MNCYKCGSKVTGPSNFCRECGADLRLAPITQTAKAQSNEGAKSDIAPARSPRLPLILTLFLSVVILAAVLLVLLLTGNLGAKKPPDTTSSVIALNPETVQVLTTSSPTPTAVPTPTPTPEPTPAESEYLLPDSSTRVLTEDDLSALSHQELTLARNEIFARHGHRFTTPQIAAYFESKSWYTPSDTETALNNTERDNVDMIADYEDEKFGGSYY